MIITDVSIGIINFFQTKGITIMKKLFAILLAAVMVCTSVFCVPVFAADAVNGAGDSNQDVNVTVDHEFVEVYAVDIEWGSLAFTYNTTYGGWNKTSHEYETSYGEWTAETTKTITVTNHSNKDVTVKTVYAPDDQKQVAGVTVSVTGDSVADAAITLRAGVESSPNTADKTEITVGVSGTPENRRADRTVTVGAITVTIG